MKDGVTTPLYFTEMDPQSNSSHHLGLELETGDRVHIFGTIIEYVRFVDGDKSMYQIGNHEQ